MQGPGQAYDVHAGPLAQTADVPRKNYGQHLVDTLITKYPELLLVGLHVTPPGSENNIITASNFGRIGKLADADDLGVIRSGKAKAELNEAGTRYAVELPMHDVSGVTIGALGLNFKYRAGDDKAVLDRHGVAIRDELARRTADAANLMEPFPWDPMATTLTHAQKIVDQTLQENPELLAITILAAAAADNGHLRVIASSIGGIGKLANTEDEVILRSGNPQAIRDALDHGRDRFAMPLLDAHGLTVGVLALEYRHLTREAREATLAEGERIRDRLRTQIPSAAGLTALDP